MTLLENFSLPLGSLSRNPPVRPICRTIPAVASSLRGLFIEVNQEEVELRSGSEVQVPAVPSRPGLLPFCTGAPVNPVVCTPFDSVKKVHTTGMKVVLIQHWCQTNAE